MNYLDLFSGIGGFHKGLLEADFKFNWCGYSEIDKYAKMIYKKHFSESEDLGDVREIKTGELISRIRHINLITFGFPCQDLSIAGKRAGLKGERSSLFNEAIRIIRDTKPDYFIFENVKGLFSSNNGRDFEYILRTIADIGYDGQWQLLNTRWVLPQNRERIYFVGHIRENRRPKIFPIGESDENYNPTNEVINCIDSNYSKGDNRPSNKSGRTLIQIGVINKDAQGQRVYSPEGASCQLTAQGGGWGAKTGLYMIQRGRGYNKGGIRELPCLTDETYHQNNFVSGIRRLTPLECERLQGFPDGWTEKGIDNKGNNTIISDSQRYRCLGNAVTVPIVKLIGKKLLTEIQKELL